eukprot:scaffold47_cov258-Pinguiococcus_pyrenoidosus.AAC.117
MHPPGGQKLPWLSRKVGDGMPDAGLHRRSAVERHLLLWPRLRRSSTCPSSQSKLPAGLAAIKLQLTLARGASGFPAGTKLFLREHSTDSSVVEDKEEAEQTLEKAPNLPVSCQQVEYDAASDDCSRGLR